MSNIANLTSRIAKLSSQLAAARADGDIELADELEDELNDLEDALEDETERQRDGGSGWGFQ